MNESQKKTKHIETINLFIVYSVKQILACFLEFVLRQSFSESLQLSSSLSFSLSVFIENVGYRTLKTIVFLKENVNTILMSPYMSPVQHSEIGHPLLSSEQRFAHYRHIVTATCNHVIFSYGGKPRYYKSLNVRRTHSSDICFVSAKSCKNPHPLVKDLVKLVFINPE